MDSSSSLIELSSSQIEEEEVDNLKDRQNIYALVGSNLRPEYLTMPILE